MSSNEIKPPKISEETMKEMAQFFLETSIPRIIEAKRREGQNQLIKKEIKDE